MLWVAGLALVGVLAVVAFRHAGTALLVDEPLVPARALVVLGGQVPFRALEAAELWKQGWATEVWLTKGAPSAEHDALRAMGIDDPDEHVLSQRVLEKQGVPPSSIRVMDGWNENTMAEIRTVADALRDTPNATVIIVTSKFHTRRVRALWDRFIGHRPRAVVRFASADPFDPFSWWRTSRGVIVVAREWFGLLNARLGFPVRSSQRGTA